MFETLPPFFRKNLPYTFQKLASREHRHVWLPLNRDYKPLGYLGEEIVNYADFAYQALVFDRDPRKFQEIWIGEILETKLWLYDEGILIGKHRDYFERLERLLSHKHSYLEAGSIAVEALESKFAVGDPVKHPKFGAGTVLGAHGIVIDVAFYGPAGRRSVVDSFLDAGI